MTINVLHVDTERGWRGGERQTLWLARELARQGHGSIVAARTGEPLMARAREAGLHVVACDPAFELDVVAAWKLRRAIQSLRIDIVHAHTAHAAAMAALATFGTRTPYVVARRVDFRLKNNLGTRFKYGRAARIIAVSGAVGSVLEGCGVARSRMAVVPDGVDVHRTIPPAEPALLAQLGVPAGAKLAVQVAQLVGHKDPVNFVRAIGRARARVTNLHGLLIGDGPLRGDVERVVREEGLADAVHLAGYRTDADALLAAADVAVLSSREEGMGSVLLDALTLGKPIAATRAGGIPEVVTPDCGLLAPVGDPHALGDAIARLASDEGLARSMGENGRRRARSFSVERMVERTVAVYSAVLLERREM